MDRCDTSASHRIKININREENEIIDPIEDNIFHLVNVSG